MMKKEINKKDNLKRFDKKISDLKIKINEDNKKDSDNKTRNSLANGLRYGVELVAGVGVGTFIGIWLDELLETTPWFMLICFLLGSIAGFTNIIRGHLHDNQQNNNDEKKIKNKKKDKK